MDSENYWRIKRTRSIKLARVTGEFVWQSSIENEDELFFVIKGKLKIEFIDKTVEINEGEMLIVPRGVEHKPIAEEEVLIMLFEPNNTKPTGEIKHRFETIEKCERI